MSGNHDQYEEWPTLNVKRKGAYLYADNGKVVCVVQPDGSKSWTPGMESESISSWESFGIYDPLQQIRLNNEVNDLINNLSNRDRK